MVGNIDIFKETGFFLFIVKILKEDRLSENFLILLEIQFVWNTSNGGQKHSLSIDVRCPLSGPVYFLFILFFAV